jgi:hypothetical protein
MPAQGGEAVQVTRDGLDMRESADGKWLYFGKYLDSPEMTSAILRTPPGGGPETLVFKGVADRFWTLAGQSLYFMEVDPKLHAAIKRLDLSARKTTRIADLEKEPFVLSGWTGLSVSPEAGWIIYPQLDQ